MPVTIDNVLELTDALVKSKYEANANTNAFTDALLTKLNGIEVGATADQLAAEVSIVDAGAYFTGTNVEAALQELGASAGNGTDDQTATEVPITDAGGYFTGTDVEAALQELGAAGNGGGITRTVDSPAAIGAASIKAVRLGGSATTFGGDATAGYDVVFQASSEITQLDFAGTSATSNASGELVLKVNNAANSYNRYFVARIVDLTDNVQVDLEIRGHSISQVHAGNINTITVPNITGNYPNGFVLVLR